MHNLVNKLKKRIFNLKLLKAFNVTLKFVIKLNKYDDVTGLNYIEISVT